MIDVDPGQKTCWTDQAACHAALRAAGEKLDLTKSVLTAADVNWLVLGLIQPSVRAIFVFLCVVEKQFVFWYLPIVQV